MAAPSSWQRGSRAAGQRPQSRAALQAPQPATGTSMASRRRCLLPLRSLKLAPVLDRLGCLHRRMPRAGFLNRPAADEAGLLPPASAPESC